MVQGVTLYPVSTLTPQDITNVVNSIGGPTNGVNALQLTNAATAIAAQQAALVKERLNLKTDFGAHGDSVSCRTNVTITAGSTSLFVTNANFTSADVGKNVELVLWPTHTNISTTIASVTSLTNIQLASAVYYGTTNGRMDYGWDDTANVQAAINYMCANTQAMVFVPQGRYFLDSPWITNTIASAPFFTMLTMPGVTNYRDMPVIEFQGMTPSGSHRPDGGSVFLCSRAPLYNSPKGGDTKDVFGTAMNWKTDFSVFGFAYSFPGSGMYGGSMTCLKLVLRNMSFELFPRFNYAGLDLSFVNMVEISDCRVGDNMDVYDSMNTATDSNGFNGGAGVIMPFNYNAMQNSLNNVVVQGASTGFVLSECGGKDKLFATWCNIGATLLSSVHAIDIGYFYPFGAHYSIVAMSNVFIPYPYVNCNIRSLDCENGNWITIYDPTNRMRGVAGVLHAFTPSSLNVIGGTNLDIIDLNSSAHTQLIVSTNPYTGMSWTIHPANTNLLIESSVGKLSLRKSGITYDAQMTTCYSYQESGPDDLGCFFGAGGNAVNNGTCFGVNANGSYQGAALGIQANGNGYGVAVGYNAIGNASGTAIGDSADGHGTQNAAIGEAAIVQNGLANTIELGNGTATLNGALHFHGYQIVLTNGVHIGNGLLLTNVSQIGVAGCVTNGRSVWFDSTNMLPPNSLTKVWIATDTNALGYYFLGTNGQWKPK